MMDKIRITNLSPGNVQKLLDYSSPQFDPPLSSSIDIKQYSLKLANNANFALIGDYSNIAGAVAYYINEAGKFIYIPYVWVDKKYTRKGFAKKLLEHIHSIYLKLGYTSFQLEVVKTNTSALALYSKLGYLPLYDKGDKYLMIKEINTNHKEEMI